MLFLKVDLLAHLLEELDKEEQLEVLNTLGMDKTGKVLDLMDNDDLASLLNELAPERIKELLSGMKKKNPLLYKT